MQSQAVDLYLVGHVQDHVREDQLVVLCQSAVLVLLSIQLQQLEPLLRQVVLYLVVHELQSVDPLQKQGS